MFAWFWSSFWICSPVISCFSSPWGACCMDQALFSVTPTLSSLLALSPLHRAPGPGSESSFWGPLLCRLGGCGAVTCPLLPSLVTLTLPAPFYLCWSGNMKCDLLTLSPLFHSRDVSGFPELCSLSFPSHLCELFLSASPTDPFLYSFSIFLS